MSWKFVLNPLFVFVLVAISIDGVRAKGFGTGKKNSKTLEWWNDHHQNFEECVKSKCTKPCETKDAIMIGEKQDYKQEVLSFACTNCEAGCFVPPQGDQMHLVVDKTGKGDQLTMRQNIGAATERKLHRQVYKRGKSWRIKN